MPAPRATYRVQLHPGFRFEDAAEITDYLADLGVSHLYSSPYLQAAPGSTHGYDVVDHSRVNTELGGAAAHGRLVAALKRRGLGQILDIVPNHMAVTGPENVWWWDVLENGRSSRYASYFDVDWDPPEAYLRNTVLLPVLGEQYGRVLDNGELSLARDGPAFRVRYFDHAFPVSPRSLDALLLTAAQRAGSDELAFVADSLSRLPPATARDRLSAIRRHRDKEVLRRQLERLLTDSEEIAAAVDGVVEEMNRSPDALDAILERQNYRLAHWRAAGRDLGYRRFFGINSLAGIRVEDEAVFDDTHALVLRMLAEGVLDGLRVDHPDGLRDPAGYFARLRAVAPDAWIVGEKILEPGERLPEWPIQGTTGYDFIERAGGLFVDQTAEERLTQIYERFTGEAVDYRELVRSTKQLVMNEELGSDLNRLTALFLDICERHRQFRDHTRHELQQTLREVVACFPVYRTYVRAETGEVSTTDEAYVAEAITTATERRPDIDARLFEFLRDLLLLRVPGELESELAMRFQQLTGPVMAKGVEDTAFYRYHRLISLNEVGCDPGHFGRSVPEWHEWAEDAFRTRPLSMLSSSTHDTKRSEDVRARIHLLSEIPDEWERAVERWSAMTSRRKSDAMPDANTEYLFYQTLVGAWPIDRDRLTAYMEKASREAKVHTTWTAPDEAFEAALRGFVAGSLGDAEFRRDVEAFVTPLVEPGRVNSLALTLLKVTAPGVPDIYQGTDVWDLSLVDPDNRRDVDYGARERQLADIAGSPPERILARMDEGAPKQWVIQRALHLRRRRPHLFGAGGVYRPIAASGVAAAHVVAFSRGGGALTVVPRLPLRLAAAGGWRDTVIDVPAGRWRNELTGEPVSGGRVSVGSILGRFPVAFLADGG